MNELNSLYCTPLDGVGRAQLTAALAGYRASQALLLVRRALGSESQQRLGAGARALNRQLERVLGLAATDEPEFRARLELG